MNNMQKFLKQAKKMQDRMQDVEKEIADSVIEIEAAGGAIVINISGDGILQSIKINPDIVDKNDVEGLEDLVLTAVNSAIKEAKDYADEKTKEVTGDIKMPGGFSF